MKFFTIVTDGLKKSVWYNPFFLRAASAALALFLLVFAIPAAPAKANALTDWEDNLQFNVSAVWSSGSSAWNSSISPGTVACTVENAANISYYDKFFVVEYAVPLTVTIKGSLANAYNAGSFKVNVSFKNTVGLGGYTMQGQDFWCDDIYQNYGQYGVSATFGRASGSNGYVVGSFAPKFMATENLTEQLEFTIHIRQTFLSTESTGSKVSNLAGHTTMTLSTGSVGYTAKYTYNEEKALEYGAQLKRIEKAIAEVKVGIENAQLALSTALNNQTNSLVSNLNDNFATLTNTVLTWGSTIDTQIQNFRQDILRYLEVDGDVASINQNNNAMKTNVDNYHQKEDSMLDDAQVKLDAVDTTDFSALKTYQQATTFWTTAVKNTADGIGSFWFLFVFGCMIGLIAFILRFI